MVSDTALHGLKPVEAVVVVSSPTTVVVTTLDIVAFAVAVRVIWTTAPIRISTSSGETRGISFFLNFN